MFYPLGKTPLSVRIERFLLAYPKAKHIPIHPNEFWALAEKPATLSRLEKTYGLPVRPIGGL